MKLSPDKINHLSDRLLDHMAEIDGVLFQGDDAQIRIAMRDIITTELQVEEHLDAEVHKLLQAYKYEITMGRMSYDELFKKIKSKLVAERRLVL